jgi:ATP-dependent protease HslVU (ClpYQ) peptidase subunit
MTTIVGLQGDGFAVVATDSRISSMDSAGFAYQVGTLSAGTSKIAQCGKYLLGAAGDVRAINLLHHAFVPPTPTPQTRGKKLDQFITMKFVPYLKDTFEEAGYTAASKDEPAEHGSTILAVINSTIYIIEGDYSWTSDNNGIYAIGTGAPYALGAIQALLPKGTFSPQQAKTILTKALNITAKFDPYTGPPVQTFAQTTTQIEK